MSLWLRQSTGVTVVVGPFVDASDGVTPETGLTISQADVRLSKNGGAFTQKSQASAATHMANGYYSVSLNTTDTGTLGTLVLAINESGALPVWREYMVVSQNTWDSFFASDNLQVHVTEINNSLITASTFAANAITANVLASDAAGEIADAVWDEPRSGHTSAGTFGQGVASVQGNVTGSVGSVTGNVGGNVTGSVGSVASPVTVGTNNDKTGYRLSATGVDDILDEAISEPSGVFSWGSATLRNIVGWLGALARNKMTQDDTETVLRNDADSADIASSQIGESDGVFTRGEWT